MPVENQQENELKKLMKNLEALKNLKQNFQKQRQQDLDQDGLGLLLIKKEN